MNSGLQGQRTELAWLRTMLSSWAVAVLTARVAFPVGIIALTGPVAVTAIGHARRRWLRDEPPPALSRVVAALMVTACAGIVVAAALMLF